jgi:hypothetical protein
MKRRALFARKIDVRGRGPRRAEYTVDMERRRTTWGTAIRLAFTLSAIAAATAWMLDSVAGLSQTAIVLTVIVVGFLTSWVRTGQAPRGSQPARRSVHRVVTVPIHGARVA